MDYAQTALGASRMLAHGGPVDRLAAGRVGDDGPAKLSAATVPQACDNLGQAVSRLEKAAASLAERLASAGVLRASPGAATRDDSRPSYGGQSELACRLDARAIEIDSVVALLAMVYNNLDV